MRRALALVLLVPLIGLAPSAMSPAVAGDTSYDVVRELDGRFDVAGYTCAGEPAAAPTARIGLSDVRKEGQGSMILRGGPDTLGAPMLVDPSKPRKVAWNTWPTATGTDPRGVWRVEMNDDVLTSDPVPLEPRSWNRTELEDATLHAGAWSGTISEYIGEFGKGEHWKVGLLTGECLGSPEVRLDSIGTRLHTFDFEARSWVALTVVDKNGSRWHSLEYGEPFRVIARAQRWDTAADRGRPVAGARIVLLRRWAGTHTWKHVARERTSADGRVALEGVARRMAYWRAVWRRTPEPVPSDYAWQGSDAVFSLPAIDGRRCRAVDDLPLTCARVTVDSGRVVLTGRGRPGGSAVMHLWLYTDDTMSERLLHRQDRLGADGRWRIAFPTGTHDELFVRLDADATSRRHFAAFVANVPLDVR